MHKIKIGIIGATGYTGSELVRILYNHPAAELKLITSESRAGDRFSDVHPAFEGVVDMKLIKAGEAELSELDVLFLALPHGVSMRYVEQFQELDIPLIDLSGDFRLDSPKTYESWYQKEHTFPQGFAGAVYGLPELWRERIRSAKLIANPGCYPTTAILGLLPAFAYRLIDPQSIVVDAKSGATGAGVKPKPVTHFGTANDNFRAYGLKNHRHTVEMEQQLGHSGAGKVCLQFTPHLLPVDRGILATIYARPAEGRQLSREKLVELYKSHFADHPFVRIVPNPPTLKEVRGSNFCNIYPDYDERTGNVIILSAIDNLVKGAAGQAVQNMNLLFDLNETEGLQQLPLAP